LVRVLSLLDVLGSGFWEITSFKYILSRNRSKRRDWKKLKNRSAISNTVAAILVVIIVIAGVGGYYAGTQTAAPAAPTTVTKTETTTVVTTAIQTATITTTTGPKVMDTLVMGTTDSVETNLDPAEAWDFFGWEIIMNTGAGLVEIAPGTPHGAGLEDIKPALATGWTISADGKTYTFNLRQGVKFYDGREFTAEDVKYSIDRGIALNMESGAYLGIGFSDIIDSVEVTGKYQVVFHLKVPFSPFLSLMAAQVSYVVNKDIATMAGTVNFTVGDARVSNPNDLGPYVLTSWSRVAGKDDEMRLDANPNYWNKAAGLPKTPHVIIKFYADATSLALAVRSGDVDVAFRQLLASDIEGMKTDPSVKVWEGTGAFIQYMLFQEKIPPFDDPKVRQAISAALDRKEMLDTVFLGQGQPLYSIIPKGMMGHTDKFQELDKDPAKAISLLEDAGYDETNKLQVELWYESGGHYPQSPDQAAVFKAQLERTGVIEVTLKGADWPSYKTNRDAEIMPVYSYGWYPDYVDPDNYVFLYWATWIQHNYENPDAVALYDQARAISDPTQRSQLYGQIDDMVVRDCPLAPLYQGGAFAVTSPNVDGVVLDISQSWRIWLLFALEG